MLAQAGSHHHVSSHVHTTRSMVTEEDEQQWLEELLFAHHQACESNDIVAMEEEQQRQDKDLSDDEWLEELLSAHRATDSNHIVAQGAGSSAQGAGSFAQGAGSSAPSSSLLGVCVAPALPLPQRPHASGAGLSASEIEGSRAEAKRVFMSNIRSMGALPNLCVPQNESVVWNLNGETVDPVVWGSQHLAAWFCVMGPVIFKIGIASDPLDRFFSRKSGYVLEERWHFMDVFWQGPANQCRQVEIDLIAATRCLEGSCNEKPGGEGVRPDRTHQCCVYMVLADAGHGISLKKSRNMRVGNKH